jgi:hypothetical protein
VIAEVVADLLDGKKRVAGWADGHKVVEAIRMIYRSQERNGGRITVSQMNEGDPQGSTAPYEEETVA